MKAMEVTDINLTIIKNAYTQGRIEAIDEFVEKIRTYGTDNYGNTIDILEIAEQMKTGLEK